MPKMQNIELKQQLRATVQALRAQHSSALIAVAMPKISARLTNFAPYIAAQSVLGYVGDAARGEIDTLPLLQNLLKTGKLLGLPRVLGKVAEGKMCVLQLSNMSELARSKLGILEPPETAPELPLAQFDLIIVPGTAFDRKGNRLGAGGGFYDRLLAQKPITKDCPTIAMAFDYQIVEAVPVLPHDVAVDFIITESQIIDCKK